MSHSLASRGALALLLAVSLTGRAPAQLGGQEIAELEGVGVEQKLEAQLPLDARFRDDQGRDLQLGELLDGSLPAILTLNYTDCPQLCSVHLNRLVQTLGLFSGKLAPGDGYRIITVSIDPRDTPEKAASMKAGYAQELARQMALAQGGVQATGGIDDALRVAALDQADAGWHFLVGDEETIGRVADAVGFGFRWLPDQQEYAHQAATILLTPDGRVARYFSGLDDQPGILRMSLVDASEGKIGSLLDTVFLNCFIYDPQEGAYVIAARRVMTIGGAVMVLVIATGFYFLKRSEPDVARTSDAAEVAR